MDSPDPEPPRTPYVPGVTERPPEGAFDHLKIVTDPVQRCPAWRVGLKFHRAGCFWEAHELWEAVWTSLPDGPDRRLVRAMIQIANARLKTAMGRGKAAALLRADAARTLETASDPTEWGLEHMDLHGAPSTDARGT